MDFLAQATPIGDLNWTSIATNLGVGVTLAWYMYFTVSTAIPAMQRQFTETLDRISDKFERSLEAERKARAEEMRMIRETFFCESGTGRYRRNDEAQA